MAQQLQKQPESNFIMYRSSAGSGKTYTLALEFVSMVIKDPHKFNRILAVTFTNKATAEMKERIMHFLHQLGDGKDSTLMAQVVAATGLSEDQVKQNAKMVWRRILHNYSQFSVSTIDAFFQRIVKSFARELGLLGNYEVELDQDKVKLEVIDKVMEDVGRNDQLTRWLVDYSFYNVDENKSWDIRPEIDKLSGEVFKESFRPVTETMQQLDGERLGVFIAGVRKIKQSFDQNMKNRAKNALKSMKNRHLTIDDFSYNVKGPAGYFDKILKGNYEPPARFLTAISNPDKWYSKTSPKKEEIATFVSEELGGLASDILEFYREQSRDYYTANAVLANIYAFGILQEVVKKISDYRQDHDVMLISDIPVFLSGIIGDNDAPFIYEKTGSWYQHYLIDEFQDTSNFQWQNFKPLIENSLAANDRNLLVGDGKQSIYRWRGGDWQLILQQAAADLRNFPLTSKNLDTNYRSEENIIQFNNAIYDQLPSTIAEILKNYISEKEVENDEWINAKCDDVVHLYQGVQQNIPEGKPVGSGYVELNIYEKSTENPWKPQVLDKLRHDIAELQQQGYAAGDIAILVRNGKEGKMVMEALLKFKKEAADQAVVYDAISNESLFLGNAVVVKLIISLFRHFVWPDDQIAASELNFFLRHLHQQQGTTEINDLAFLSDQSALPEDFEVWQQQVMHLPAYDLVEEVIRKFGLAASEYKGYLQAFQDVILKFFADEQKNIQDFLTWWDDSGWKTSVQLPEASDAIRVMTIHKSKGLQFGAVILPFCDWMIDHDTRKGNMLWSYIQKEPYDKMGFLPVKYHEQLTNTWFAHDYLQEKIRAHIDNLNLLYVATTRAKSCLIIHTPASDKLNHAGALLTEVVQQIFNKNEMLPVNERTVDILKETVDYGLQYMVGNLNPGKKNEQPAAKIEAQPYRSSDWQQKVNVRKRSTLMKPEGNDNRLASVNYGLLMHEILAGISNREEAEKMVSEFLAEGRVATAEAAKLKEQLSEIFENPKVSAWFDSDWEVKRETPIIVQRERPRRPDRVMVHGKKAIIIDFKTGLPKPADRKQIMDYKHILKQMGHDDTRGYLLYIADNRVEEV